MEQRLIDANKLDLRFEYGVYEDGLLLVPFRDIQRLVDKAPTVDAMPLVRCRGCRKLKTYECPMPTGGYDDFCSHGERRRDDEQP